MTQRSIRRTLTLCALALVPATFAVAQSSTSPETAVIPIGNAGNDWRSAQAVESTKGKLFVVTLDQPHRRQICRVQSFTPDELVCNHSVGGPRTYLRQRIVALILPGDGKLKVLAVAGLNVGLATAIWGTVVLAGTCPVCAVITGFAALYALGGAGVFLFGDDQPDRLLYLAPGQQLTGKLRTLRP